MPLPPNVNGVYQEVNTIVNAALATALANPLYQPQSKPLIEEFNVGDTAVDFRFLLDNRGLRKLKKNIEKKAAIEKKVTIITEEWHDNLTIALRDLKSTHADLYRKQADTIGANVGPWEDQQVAQLLKSGGAGFTTPLFDGVPYFSGAHPMTLAGETISAYANLDSGGGGNYWYLFDTRRVKPIFLNWKTRPEPQNLGPDSEHAKLFFEVMWNVYADAGFGLTLWHYGYASNQTLNESFFNAARIAMEAVPTYAKGEDGDQVMGVMPNLLVVGRSNRLAAEKLIMSETINGGDKNPLYKATDLLVLSYLP
jgi:phage major head subunit gpT-like protein